MCYVTKTLPYTIYVIWGSSCKGTVTRLGLLLGSDQQQDRGDYILKSAVPRASQGQEKMAWDFPVT